jgi:hypothetical protein
MVWKVYQTRIRKCEGNRKYLIIFVSISLSINTSKYAKSEKFVILTDFLGKRRGQWLATLNYSFRALKLGISSRRTSIVGSNVQNCEIWKKESMIYGNPVS